MIVKKVKFLCILALLIRFSLLRLSNEKKENNRGERSDFEGINGGLEWDEKPTWAWSIKINKRLEFALLINAFYFSFINKNSIYNPICYRNPFLL